MKEMMPCKDCILLACCIGTGVHTNGITTLANKCSLLDEWLTGDGGGWDIELIYDVYAYFARGEINEVDPHTL